MPTELPAPRLQLRYRKPTDDEMIGRSPDWVCVYELILPLREHDIRREREDIGDQDFMALEISKTFVGTTRTPCNETPFRDGAHAKWDSEVLGRLPIYAIDPDGTPHLQDREPVLNAAAAVLG